MTCTAKKINESPKEGTFITEKSILSYLGLGIVSISLSHPWSFFSLNKHWMTLTTIKHRLFEWNYSMNHGFLIKTCTLDIMLKNLCTYTTISQLIFVQIYFYYFLPHHRYYIINLFDAHK